MNHLEELLRRRIMAEGPVNIAEFMALALSHPQYGYYMTRDPFGKKGDFTTAPEISQMFGELIGAWMADTWMKMDKPSPFMLLECGPGRGTLMADALRATRGVPGFQQAARIVLLEISPVLREKQKQALSGYDVEWVSDIRALPYGSPVIAVANEFFDALPVRQYRYANDVWRERVIDLDSAGRLYFDERVSMDFEAPPDPSGAWHEVSKEREDFAGNLCRLIREQRGAALVIDYGYEGPAKGETLQAVRDQRPSSVLEHIGDSDITAHVDFGSLRTCARRENVFVTDLIGQGLFLTMLGIQKRAEALEKKATADQRRDIKSALQRLTAPEQMGSLFKVMALCDNKNIHFAGL